MLVSEQLMCPTCGICALLDRFCYFYPPHLNGVNFCLTIFSNNTWAVYWPFYYNYYFNTLFGLKSLASILRTSLKERSCKFQLQITFKLSSFLENALNLYMSCHLLVTFIPNRATFGSYKIKFLPAT